MRFVPLSGFNCNIKTYPAVYNLLLKMKKIFWALCFLALSAISCSKKSGIRSQGEIPSGVNVTTNVEYGRSNSWLGGNQSLTLDVYAPKEASAQHSYPLLVMMHGGSFLTGSKESISDICGALAEKGLIVASINYRLGWDARGTADCEGDTASLNEAAYRAMQDLNASLRFLTANADKYFIDTSWIFTGGASAGAVAALNGAYLNDAAARTRFSKAYNKLGSLYTADNNLTNTYSIKGICSMWGGIFDPGIITANNAIPAIFYHGSEDATIPVTTGTYLKCPNYQTLYGSAYLYAKLTSLDVPAVLHIYQGGGHGPAEYSGNAEFIASTTYCFFHGLQNKLPETGLFKQMESNCK